MLDEFEEFLKKVNPLPLVTGFEEHFVEDFRKIVQEYLPEHEVIVEEKNVIALGTGDIALSAHYDEIGFVITNQYRDDLYRTLPFGLVSFENGYGKVFQTQYQGRIIKGVGSSPMPHLDTGEKRLFLDMFEPVELPAMWPFTFEDRVINTGDKLYSKAIDDRGGVFLALKLAKKYGLSVLLMAGEEEGTTRLEQSLKKLPNTFIEIDAMFSTQDEHAPESALNENELGFVAVEGAGKGNKAPDFLVKITEKYGKEVKTQSKYEVTDATTLYRKGKQAIALVFPLRYLHSSLECISKQSLLSSYSKIDAILEELLS